MKHKQHILEALRSEMILNRRDKTRQLLSQNSPERWVGLLEVKGSVHFRQSKPYESGGRGSTVMYEEKHATDLIW